jgi:ATP synthase protein I
MASVGKRETFVSDERDTRSSVSIGMDWGARITSIGLEFALPAFLGYALDRWWGTSPWMTLAGAVLGLVIGMLHVLRLAATLSQTSRKPYRPHRPPRSPDNADSV